MPRVDLIRIRRGTEAEWNASLEPLKFGEPGVIVDENDNALALVVGNGGDDFNALPRFTPGPDIVQVIDTSGDYDISAAAEWTDIDSKGTAASRPTDVVLAGLRVGDYFDFRPIINISPANNYFLANVAVIVDGSVVRRLSPHLYGFTPWQKQTNVGADIFQTSPRYTVEEGDLSDDGTLRLRLQYTLSSGSRTVYANPDIPFTLEGRGPLGRELA